MIISVRAYIFLSGLIDSLNPIGLPLHIFSIGLIGDKMKKLPFIKLYPKDVNFDTYELTDTELGEYLRLLLISYRDNKLPQKYNDHSLFIELKKSLNISKKYKYSYVYKITHNESRRYYIGSRSCNTTPDKDIYYGSGSWKPSHDSIHKEIIKVFDDRCDANNFEKDLIKKHINDHQCMNIKIGG